jgi:TIR domain
MATIREYFDTDFGNAVRVSVKLPIQNNVQIDAAVLYDFAPLSCFVTCFVAGHSNSLDLYREILASIEFGRTQLMFDHTIRLPSAKTFHGCLRIENPLQVKAKFYGENDWISMSDFSSSTRIIIYSETQLADEELRQLKEFSLERNLKVLFWSDLHARQRSAREKPLAFISHDSRDKDVAKSIAIGLSKLMCPVWYDEFSLKVGDRLRENIERGLKEYKKCIIVLSPNFSGDGPSGNLTPYLLERL